MRGTSQSQGGDQAVAFSARRHPGSHAITNTNTGTFKVFTGPQKWRNFKGSSLQLSFKGNSIDFYCVTSSFHSVWIKKKKKTATFFFVPILIFFSAGLCLKNPDIRYFITVQMFSSKAHFCLPGRTFPGHFSSISKTVTCKFDWLVAP